MPSCYLEKKMWKSVNGLFNCQLYILFTNFDKSY